MFNPLIEAFPIVASALGRTLGVKVEVGGDRARTNGNVVQIPSLKDASDQTRSVAWGYLAHEAAHLRWTDFDVFREGSSSPLRRALLNVLEDARIERRLFDHYPGTRLNLEATVASVLESGGFSLPDPTAAMGAHLQAYCLLLLRSRDLGQKLLDPLKAESFHRLHHHFGADGMDRLHSLLEDITTLGSTAEALERVDHILHLLKSGMDKEASPEDPDGASESKTPPDGEGSKAMEAKSADGAEESFSTEGGVSEADLMPDPFTIAASLLEKETASGTGPTLPVADDPPPGGDESLALLDRVRTESARLRGSLEGMMQSLVERQRLHRSRGQRMDGRRLHRLGVNDPRVFMCRSERQRPDTAVHLLIDRSPSMSALVARSNGGHARRIDLAWEASLALTLALEAIPGVNPGVTAFPGHLGESTRVYRILPHGSRLSAVRDRLITDLDGSTPLTEALLYGASELIATRERRKVIFVLTDGIPDDLDSAITLLERIRASGIEVHGIGLALDVGRVFGPSICIQDLGELKARLFDLCRGVLSNTP